jgi:hypothetical protein
VKAQSFFRQRSLVLLFEVDVEWQCALQGAENSVKTFKRDGW